MSAIEIPDEQLSLLKAKAFAQGLSLEAWLKQLAEEATFSTEPRRPLKTGRGMLAKYGTAPSAEEIDQNRLEMFGNFAREV